MNLIPVVGSPLAAGWSGRCAGKMRVAFGRLGWSTCAAALGRLCCRGWPSGRTFNRPTRLSRLVVDQLQMHTPLPS